MAGFYTCGPNECIILSGVFYDKAPLTVVGGRCFKWPWIQQIQRLSLNTMTLNIDSRNVYTKLGVAVNVNGVAQVKIAGKNKDMLEKACQVFLKKSTAQIQEVCKETLEGHQRAIMGQMTVEEIYKDRKKFSEAVFEVASTDLVNMGITIISYTIKDIKDDHGYLKALGMARTSQVKRDARIGEAEAKRDSGIKEAIAEEQRMASRYDNDTKIAQAKRDYQLKKAEYDKEVETKRAASVLAYDLQKAKTKQLIMEENSQIKVVERMQEIKIQEEEMARKEKELNAKVRQPAEAEKYRMEKLAEANKNQVILEGEALAESIKLAGEAEAFAIEAKAKAEAEQMAKKADAWKDYEEAAKVSMVLDVLPRVAAECAAPLQNCSKIKVVSSGSGDIGAAKLTGEIVDIMAKLPELVEKNTGVSLIDCLASTSTRNRGAAGDMRGL